jgi:hypothetical protein
MELNLRQLTIIMNKIADNAIDIRESGGSNSPNFSGKDYANRALSRFKFIITGDIKAGICYNLRAGNWDCSAPPFHVVHTNWLVILIHHPKFRLRYKVDMPEFNRNKLNGPFAMKIKDHYATAECYCEGTIVGYRLTPLASIEEVEEELVKLLL